MSEMEQLRLPGLEDLTRVKEGLESESLKIFGQNLIDDNFHEVLMKEHQGPTRKEGKWIVCYRPHLERYVEQTSDFIDSLLKKDS